MRISAWASEIRNARIPDNRAVLLSGDEVNSEDQPRLRRLGGTSAPVIRDGVYKPSRWVWRAGGNA